MKRRDFVKNAGLAALAGVAAPQSALETLLKGRRVAGLQLFTLFNVLDKDVRGNLKKVADLGFKEVESAFSLLGGYYGLKPLEFKQLLADVGLTWRSHHVFGAPFKPRPGFDLSKMPKMLSLKTDAQQIMDEVSSTGVKYVVCANIPLDSADEVKEAVDILGKAGEKAKKAGLTLVYHNHDWEFKPVADLDNKTPYDIFLSQLSADVLKMELDLGWVSKAGVDPVALFKKHPKRFPLWHVKDFDSGFTTIKPVGEGVIDFKRLFDNAAVAGMKHFFVEHDMPADPFASITSSVGYLKKQGII